MSADDVAGPSRRIARLYQVEEAQIVLDDMPSDLSEEDPDSDPDDPVYEPEPVISRRTDDVLNFASTSTETDEDDEPEVVPTTRKWRKRDMTDCSGDFPYPQGPCHDIFGECTKPVDYFLKFFDSTIEENLVYQTNLYANQKGRTVLPFTLQELRGFIGINMVMGYHCLPSYTHYWSGQPDLGLPIIASTMTKSRFQNLLANLHVNDDMAERDGVDKLWKLRSLINRLNNNFVKLYNVSRIQSIDESMILFKGRSCLKQYCPIKPIKRGFKLWVRADLDGYISKFSIYQGRGTGGNAIRNFGLGENVVADLCSDILDRGHLVFFDNFFTSLPLLSYLKDNRTWACGTIRANRKGLPQGMQQDKTMKRGDFDFRTSDDGLLFCKWMDSKPVSILSNFHSTAPTSVNRIQKDGTRLEVPCPQSIRDYSSFMGGVDKADMLCGAYGLSRKSKKWWQRLFFGLIDRTLVNSFIAYSKISDDNKSLLNILRDVALSLITLSRPPK